MQNIKAMRAKVVIPFSLKKTGTVGNIRVTHFVRGAYLAKLVELDLIPLFVSPIMSDSQVDQIVSEARGLLLCGGNDIEPDIYGEPRNPMTEISTPERDILEITLIKRFEAACLPVLGICRGCQALAVASGGKLNQHIPDLGINEVHGQSEENIHEHIAPYHEVIVEPASAISQIIGKSIITTNSFHHQSVKSVGKSLKIVGRTKAGIVELIEHSDRQQFIFGVQSHPELEADGELEPLWLSFAKRVSAGG